MRALVTGGAGFIGSALVDRLLADGFAVDVVDDLSSGSLANLADAVARAGGAAKFHYLDIRSPGLVDLMRRRRPGVVFHLAAQTDVRVSVADPVADAAVNVGGTLNVLEGARRAGVSKVVFASSAAIYGAGTVMPLDECVPQRPLSPYGVAKKAAFDYLDAYAGLYGLDFTALAFANVYGPRQGSLGEAGVVAIFVRRMLDGFRAWFTGMVRRPVTLCS